MLNAMEALILKDLRERSGLIFAMMFLLIVIPDATLIGKFLFIVILLGNLLSRTIHNGKISLLTTLPVSYNQIYWTSFFFMSVLILFSSIMGNVLFGLFDNSIISAYIFAVAYWSIGIICSLYKLDPVGIPMIILFIDFILGLIPVIGENYFAWISPVHQGNVFTAAIFAVVLLAFSWTLFLKRGAVR